jgi:hypothetical protein
MGQPVQEGRKNSERILQREREKRKGKIIGVVIAVFAIVLLSSIFTPIDIAMISGMLGAGIITFSIGAATAAMSIFPRFSQASITLGLILIGASLILYVLATIVLNFGNSRLVTP